MSTRGATPWPLDDPQTYEGRGDMAFSYYKGGIVRGADFRLLVAHLCRHRPRRVTVVRGAAHWVADLTYAGGAEAVARLTFVVQERTLDPEALLQEGADGVPGPKREWVQLDLETGLFRGSSTRAVSRTPPHPFDLLPVGR